MSTRNKYKPQRTCIGCRQIKEKKDLIRLVCNRNEVIEIDSSAKKPGRGAYLCPKKDCWELGVRKNYLERALRTKLSDDNRLALIEYSSKLPERS